MQASSVPPTPVEGILPMKKRESSSNDHGAAGMASAPSPQHNDLPTGTVTVDFVEKKLKDKAMTHLVQACKNNKRVVFLVCANHQAGDNFEQSVPFWFDGLASLNEGPPTQLQFVRSQRSHVEAVAEDGSDFYHDEPHLFYSFRFDEHVTGMVFRCHVELAPQEDEAPKSSAKKRKTKEGKQNNGASLAETAGAPHATPGEPEAVASKKKKPLSPEPPGSDAAKKKKSKSKRAAAIEASENDEDDHDDGAKEVALEAVDRLERHVQGLLEEVASLRRKIRKV